MIDLDEKKIYWYNGGKLTLPKVLNFNSDINPKFHEYKIVGFKKPEKGEFYLSGAKIEVWKAPNDLGQDFWVIKPTTEYETKSIRVFIKKK